jgi:hypothetical protein
MIASKCKIKKAHLSIVVEIFRKLQHYDGCNMEDEFAFSGFATMEEWEEEQRTYDEWERERSATEKAI